MSSEEETSPPREPIVRSCPGAPRKKGRDTSYNTNHIEITPRKLFSDVPEEDEKAIPKKSTLRTIVRPNGHVEQSNRQTGK
mmetsp:Transcript_1588/g.3256  ORF Transcript_1588/g.3256 Transcript_1588/m.3256 type:complete len:81 (+) Transcript_1588:1099-1341(+)|eukprot:CAMPEP_0113606072 /NCGR_PEP_ID=MMETSP0017_2-20120614/2663_1 /TAXON_ID=2856 /ORGANISM="Cylindrotheca closterium" /LENGTH=80 /DNA_ID=CAMNT_0000514599 /DNA_START=258 /DNA_END=500 /DNA_ORIENTATION=- /assembly_acc=CAM_ASM_000147